MPALVLDAPSLTMPRQWAQQSQLLERQHDRLEALLADLIERHANPTRAAAPGSWSSTRAIASACCASSACTCGWRSVG